MPQVRGADSATPSGAGCACHVLVPAVSANAEWSPDRRLGSSCGKTIAGLDLWIPTLATNSKTRQGWGARTVLSPQPAARLVGRLAQAEHFLQEVALVGRVIACV